MLVQNGSTPILAAFSPSFQHQASRDTLSKLHWALQVAAVRNSVVTMMKQPLPGRVYFSELHLFAILVS